jgi:hypothetical protein
MHCWALKQQGDDCQHSEWKIKLSLAGQLMKMSQIEMFPHLEPKPDKGKTVPETKEPAWERPVNDIVNPEREIPEPERLHQHEN